MKNRTVRVGGRLWLEVRTRRSSRHHWTVCWAWSHKDGSPVLNEEAVWWRHISGVIVLTPEWYGVLLFRHNREVP